MVSGQSNRAKTRGPWVVPVAAVFFALTAMASDPVAAQRAVPTAPYVPPIVAQPPPIPQLPTGTGGLQAPDFTPAPIAPTPVAPTAPAPGAAMPVPLIRFRCEVAPGDSTCREQGPPDGGGDETCDCTRDFCYADPAGARFCEKS